MVASFIRRRNHRPAAAVVVFVVVVRMLKARFAMRRRYSTNASRPRQTPRQRAVSGGFVTRSAGRPEPSPGTPGEGWVRVFRKDPSKTLTPALSRRTGRGRDAPSNLSRPFQ